MKKKKVLKPGKYKFKFQLLVVLLIIIIGGYFLLKNGTGARLNVKEPIKIGVITPLTGVSSSYGIPARDIYMLAAAKINNDGGIDRNPIKLIVADGECNEVGGAKAAQKLINTDHVQIIIGGFCSGESKGAIPFGTVGKIAFLSPVSTDPGLSGISTFFARTSPDSSQQGMLLASVAIEQGLRKMAVVQEQTEYSVGLFNSFNSSFTAKGGTIMKQEFASTDTNLRTVLSKLRYSNQDGLFIIVQTPATAKLVFKQLDESGWKPKLFLNDIIPGFPNLISSNKDLLEGAITTEVDIDRNNPKFKEMLAAYTAVYAVEPPLFSYAQSEYDSVFIVADAIRAVGYDGTKIANWLHNNVKDWQGAAGPVTIDSNGDLLKGISTKIIKDGKVKQL